MLMEQPEMLMFLQFFAILIKVAVQSKKHLLFDISGTVLHKTTVLGLTNIFFGHSTFKCFILKLIPYSHPPFLKMAAVNINVPISSEICHLESYIVVNA